MLQFKRVLNTSPQLRDGFQQLFKDKIWKPVSGLDLYDERDLAYNRLKAITREKLIRVGWFKTDPTAVFDAHEMVGMMDGSTSTKMTVQFNLFGGTVLNLGTDKHHGEFLDSIDSLENVGCFGFTERGYGNNAFKMETTAEYDHSNKSFLLNSPTKASNKYWITNSVCHANHAVVFGQLNTNGENYGPHPFLVKIRDDTGKLIDSVNVTDMGYKLGLNGVDNGEMKFTNLVAPASSLLDGISQMTDDGKFVSSVENKRRRFLKMADQLVSGRLCISSMMLGCSKTLLNNTIRYASNRFSIDKNGESTMPIINYGIQKSILTSLLVRTIGLNLGLNKAKDAYSTGDPELMTLACTVKPLLAWHTQEVVTKCRELSGGEGFHIDNQFGEGFAASQAGLTAEGDSKVLLMKTTSELIKTLDKPFIMKIKIGSLLPKGLTSAFMHREHSILANLAIATQKSGAYYDVWMDTHSQLVQDAARAYCDRVIFEEFSKYDNMPGVDYLKEYFLLDCITREALWYCSNNEISPRNMRYIINRKLQLENKIMAAKDQYLDLFDIPDHMMHAPMANYKPY